MNPPKLKDFLRHLIERCEHGDINAECEDADWRLIYLNAQRLLAMYEEPKVYDAVSIAHRLCREALPKFNWGASALDSNAITLLNRAPSVIEDALIELERAREV